jgi:hypothetical protein
MTNSVNLDYNDLRENLKTKKITLFGITLICNDKHIVCSADAPYVTDRQNIVNYIDIMFPLTHFNKCNIPVCNIKKAIYQSLKHKPSHGNMRNYILELFTNIAVRFIRIIYMVYKSVGFDNSILYNNTSILYEFNDMLSSVDDLFMKIIGHSVKHCLKIFTVNMYHKVVNSYIKLMNESKTVVLYNTQQYAYRIGQSIPTVDENIMVMAPRLLLPKNTITLLTHMTYNILYKIILTPLYIETVELQRSVFNNNIRTHSNYSCIFPNNDCNIDMVIIGVYNTDILEEIRKMSPSNILYHKTAKLYDSPINTNNFRDLFGYSESSICNTFRKMNPYICKDTLMYTIHNFDKYSDASISIIDKSIYYLLYSISDLFYIDNVTVKFMVIRIILNLMSKFNESTYTSTYKEIDDLVLVPEFDKSNNDITYIKNYYKNTNPLISILKFVNTNSQSLVGKLLNDCDIDTPDMTYFKFSIVMYCVDAIVRILNTMKIGNYEHYQLVALSLDGYIYYSTYITDNYLLYLQNSYNYYDTILSMHRYMYINLPLNIFCYTNNILYSFVAIFTNNNKTKNYDILPALIKNNSLNLNLATVNMLRDRYFDNINIDVKSVTKSLINLVLQSHILHQSGDNFLHIYSRNDSEVNNIYINIDSEPILLDKYTYYDDKSTAVTSNLRLKDDYTPLLNGIDQLINPPYIITLTDNTISSNAVNLMIDKDVNYSTLNNLYTRYMIETDQELTYNDISKPICYVDLLNNQKYYNNIRNMLNELANDNVSLFIIEDGVQIYNSLYQFIEVTGIFYKTLLYKLFGDKASDEIWDEMIYKPLFAKLKETETYEQYTKIVNLIR